MFNKLMMALIFIISCQTVSAAVIDLFSGNGSVGGTDSEITFLRGPSNASFSSAFTSSDFLAARNGSAAFIINNHPAWVPAGLAANGGNASAQWISDFSTGASEGSSALYAIDFEISFAAIDTAVLDFYWSVDNALGGGSNTGVYINGQAVGSISGGTFNNRFSDLNNDIASLLVSGTNTLYINATDTGGPGGLIFSASIEVLEDTNQVPVSTPLILIGLGLLTIIFLPSRKPTKNIFC